MPRSGTRTFRTRNASEFDFRFVICQRITDGRQAILPLNDQSFDKKVDGNGIVVTF